MKIEKTYRNSQELVNAAADFVMQNPAQIEKHPVSDKHCACPITFYLYRSQVSEPIEKALNDFISRYGKTKNILILGRTNNDKKILPEDLFKVYNSGKVVYSKAPDTRQKRPTSAPSHLDDRLQKIPDSYTRTHDNPYTRISLQILTGTLLIHITYRIFFSKKNPFFPDY